MVGQQILFLTLYPFDTLEDGYIAADLANELVKQHCNLTIVSPTTDVNATKSIIQTEKGYKHYHIASGAIQKVNAIKKVLGLRKLDKASSKFLLKDAFKYSLIITMVSHCAFYKTVKKIKKINKRVIVYNLVKDIFPQNVADLGMLSTRSLFFKFFQKEEEKYYKLSDFLGVISPYSVKYFRKHYPYINSSQIECNPNSIIPRRLNLTEKQKVEIRKKYLIPEDKIVCIYGGNLGKPQGIDFLLDCIVSNENRKDTFFLIIGSGTEFNYINQFLHRRNILNTKLFPAIPHSDYQKVTESSDIGLVFLNRSFSIPNYPSRVLSYMEATLPIVFAVDSNCDAAIIADTNKYGFAGINGDIAKFNENIDSLIASETLRKAMGQNGYNYLLKEYTSARSVDIILKHFNNNNEK